MFSRRLAVSRFSLLLLASLACDRGRTHSNAPPGDAGFAPPLGPSFVFPPAAIAPFQPSAVPLPKAARKRPVPTPFHGRSLVDDYGWMRRKGTAELETWLRGENAYTDAVMAPVAPLREALATEMKSRIAETDSSAPTPLRGYSYYQRVERSKQYPVLCRRRAGSGPEEIVLDGNAMAEGQKYFDIGAWEVSDDNRLLAFTTDVSGFSEYVLEVKDLATGKKLAERIPHVTSVAWAADHTTIFYTTDNEAKRSYRLFRHVLGSPSTQDPLVYEEKDEHFDLKVSRSRSLDFLVVVSASLTTTEVRVVEAAAPRAGLRVVLPKVAGREYWLDHHGSSFFLRTNDTGRHFRLVEVPVDAPQVQSRWRELIPHRPEAMLEDVEVFRDHYVVRERVGGRSQLRLVAFASGQDVVFDLPSEVGSVTSAGNPQYDTQVYRYVFTSLLTPPTTFERDLLSGHTKVLKVEPVPGYHPERYEVQRVVAAVGLARVPISLVYPKGLRRDGTHPLLLRGYGAYGDSYDPTFSSTDVSLLDRGVVVAIAHVRGGGDLGKSWHDAGRMMNKKNTFGDFVGCAEYLIAERWTSSDRLAINGMSAGGLLMGAVLNARPELFRVALVDVPFVDVIRTMLDPSVPLTVQEFEEWGNPKDKAAGEYMLSYSPYDNLGPRAYPAIFVRSAYNDSQVLFHEPSKYVAKLRALKTDSNPLLFHMEMNPAGHTGRSGRYTAAEDEALVMAYVLWQLGITK